MIWKEEGEYSNDITVITIAVKMKKVITITVKMKKGYNTTTSNRFKLLVC